MKLNIDGGYLISEKVGSGIPLLLIHGYPLSRKMWEPQVVDLVNDVTIITIDLRGHGDSFAFNGAYSMTMLAEDCLKVLHNHQINEPVIVCGHSMGGYITMAMYHQFPEVFRGMILNSTRPGSDSIEGKANRDASIKIALEKGSAPIADSMIQKMFSPVTYQAKPELVNKVHKIMASTSPVGISGALKAMRDRPDSTPMLSTIQCPVLIIHGEDDQLIPVKEADAMGQLIPDAHVVKIAQAGHLPCLEQPEFFNQSVRDFLSAII